MKNSRNYNYDENTAIKNEQENIKKTEDTLRQEQKQTEDKKLEEQRIAEQRQTEDRKREEDNNKTHESLRMEEARRRREQQKVSEEAPATVYKQSDDAKKAQEMKERGNDGVVIPGGAIVNDYYRNINQARRDLQAERREQSKGKEKLSPAMEKYKAHEKAISSKVNERINVQSQTKGQGHSR